MSIAVIAALAILITVVLPAEYGVDPTRIGRVLGLTEMGEIKQQLAEEAEADRQKEAAQDDQSNLLNDLLDGSDERRMHSGEVYRRSLDRHPGQIRLER